MTGELDETEIEIVLLEKEPFYQSVRFWVAVLTPVVSVLMAAAAEYVPALAQLDTEVVTAIIASVIIMAVTFIGSRTLRNTRV